MKVLISSIIRSIGLLFYFDKLRYKIIQLKTLKSRKEFRTKFPEVKLPTDYLIYESFGLNYDKYYNDGKDTAQWLAGLLSKHVELKGLKILDWGCGPARIVRHMPEILNFSCEIYGTDYNETSIKWDKNNIENVNFFINQITPPLQFPDNFFNIIYGISIFTHLSEKLHFEWFNELVRVTQKGGILFLTTHGNAFKCKLLPSEQEKFSKGEVVIKGNTKEGHRTFGAFHPESFFRKVVGNNEVLEFIEGDISNGKPVQDIWLIKKV